ncbi:MAG: hypothetical protein PHE55_18280 [Methylococcaceae bacterium]|nr:hypothetical protein [Methylococcaceae bacterium]
MSKPQPNLADIAKTAGVTESDLIRLVHELESPPKKPGRPSKPKSPRPPKKRGPKFKLTSEKKYFIASIWATYSEDLKVKKQKTELCQTLADQLEVDESSIRKVITELNKWIGNGGIVLVESFRGLSNKHNVHFILPRDTDDVYIGIPMNELYNPSPWVRVVFRKPHQTVQINFELAQQHYRRSDPLKSFKYKKLDFE